MSPSFVKVGKAASVALWSAGIISFIFPEQMPLADTIQLICMLTLEIHFFEALYFMISKKFRDEDRSLLNLLGIMAFGYFQLQPLMHPPQEG